MWLTFNKNGTFWLKMRDMLSPDGLVMDEDFDGLRFTERYPIFHDIFNWKPKVDIYPLFKQSRYSDNLYEVDKTIQFSSDMELKPKAEAEILCYLRDQKALERFWKAKLTADRYSISYLLTDENLQWLKNHLEQNPSFEAYELLTSWVAQFSVDLDDPLSRREKHVLQAIMEMQASSAITGLFETKMLQKLLAKSNGYRGKSV